VGRAGTPDFPFIPEIFTVGYQRGFLVLIKRMSDNIGQETGDT